MPELNENDAGSGSGASFADGASDAGSTDDAQANQGGEGGENQGGEGGGSEDAPTLSDAFLTEDGSPDVEKLAAHFKESAAAATTRSELMGEVPEGDYSLDIAIKDDSGAALTIDGDNETVKEFLTEAKTMGLGQKVVTGFLEKHAKNIQEVAASVLTAQKESVDAEIASLGEASKSRIIAVKNSIAAAIGEDTGVQDATEILSGVQTKASFEALEKLIGKINGADENVSLDGSRSGKDKRSDADILYNSSGSA